MPKATTLRSKAQRGFTLVELMVVILIVGILAAFAVPQYQKSLEISKAENAVAMANMIATASRMYALDHGGKYPAGWLSSGRVDPGFGNCNTATCTGGSNPWVCDLVACKYLAATDFDALPYIYITWPPSSGSTLLNAYRRGLYRGSTLAGPSGTATSPYTGWSYKVDFNGVITPFPAGGPPNGPPTPTQ